MLVSNSRYVNRMTDYRIERVEDVLDLNEQVWVKVIAHKEREDGSSQLSLSMRYDQCLAMQRPFNSMPSTKTRSVRDAVHLAMRVASATLNRANATNWSRDLTNALCRDI
jgi:predicted RNA-binding protein with RPS1 domain